MVVVRSSISIISQWWLRDGCSWLEEGVVDGLNVNSDSKLSDVRPNKCRGEFLLFSDVQRESCLLLLGGLFCPLRAVVLRVPWLLGVDKLDYVLF